MENLEILRSNEREFTNLLVALVDRFVSDPPFVFAHRRYISSFSAYRFKSVGRGNEVRDTETALNTKYP